MRSGTRSPRASPISCLTLTQQLAAPVAESGSATQAAILNRICQIIERNLEDGELTPARIAQTEGISERYLQKLFEGSGDNFTHYVRERRLQRAWADLANPAEAHHTISEIAYRYGFADSAHFSRTFRHRFGLSPREFRQQEAERIASLRHRRGPSRLAAGRAGAASASARLDGGEDDCCRRQRASLPMPPANRPIIIWRSARNACIGAFSAARCSRRRKSAPATPSPSRR